MGRVFLGASPGGRRVAVKIVHPRYADDPEFRQRFAREVAAARRVGGFHAALVVDADPAADPPWMATAYIPGPSLAEAIAQRGPLDEAALRERGRRWPRAWRRSTPAGSSTATSSPVTSSWPTTGRASSTSASPSAPTPPNSPRSTPSSVPSLHVAGAAERPGADAAERCLRARHDPDVRDDRARPVRGGHRARRDQPDTQRSARPQPAVRRPARHHRRLPGKGARQPPARERSRRALQPPRSRTRLGHDRRASACASSRDSRGPGTHRLPPQASRSAPPRRSRRKTPRSTSAWRPCCSPISRAASGCGRPTAMPWRRRRPAMTGIVREQVEACGRPRLQDDGRGVSRGVRRPVCRAFVGGGHPAGGRRRAVAVRPAHPGVHGVALGGLRGARRRLCRPGGEPGRPVARRRPWRSGAGDGGGVRAAGRPAARRDRASGSGRAAPAGPGSGRTGLPGDRAGPGRGVRPCCARWTTRRCATTCRRRRPTSWAGPPSWPSCASLVSGGSRLVTIAGPGGIGKSRLALQVAAEVLDGTGDGVWLVELAPVAEPELVARTVAAVLGVREAAGTARARHPGRRGRRPVPADGPRQRRARARRGRQAGGRPHPVLPAGVPAGHEQGAAGHQRGARLPGSPAWRSRPPISPPPTGWPPSSRCSCSPSTPRCTGRASPSTTPTPRRWRRSASASTGFRWPSSSPRPGSARCRCRRSTPGSISGSGC